MAIQFEAYSTEGILRGTVGPGGRLGDLLETFASLTVEDAVAMPLDGRPATRVARVELVTDDLLVVVAPASTPAPIHASWHELALRSGPYLVEGLLPTLPGFDPARALARPTGTFVLLASVHVALAEDPAGGGADHQFAWVNRYTVEQVQADIELGIFFPGATSILVSQGGRPEPAAAGPPSPAVST